MKSRSVADLLEGARVVAVLVIDDVAAAVPLARALVGGGIRTIEVTLRSSSALDAIAAIAAGVPDALVGAGTVVAPGQFAEVQGRGARFAVSPGATPALCEAAAASPVPWLPGAQTVTEMMALRDRGYLVQKFFPAEPSGGVAFLKALASPLPDLRFCPTGGIGERNAGDYLALPNVLCVGGSWMAPPALVKAGDWSAVAALAARVSAARH
ncbi:MAG TPA: bifunctional 4-hydroxy-2-oxoglutarate aldolase/2-dehydro-3-deoxy-phosphogluconate aldolase [Aestuariivirgaceae bacterium]|nr:bifunctional 4-hydroxy-2-oxoglutarate aldolase/2-dehydro-3-deoxy-phosphogluconate aldolase [Aestuariivirgaceae bacterium]